MHVMAEHFMAVRACAHDKVRACTLWQSIFTAGSLMLGVHIVTTPFRWPRCTKAFQGLTRRQSQSPSRVEMSDTFAPVDTSR